VDRDGAIVGPGDVVVQAKQAYANLRVAVEAAGATMADIAKVTAYVVNYDANLFPQLLAVRQEAFGGHTPASTLAGVSALARSDYLFEVEAVAVVD
jgi:enamine deaminase RidA (YjgF/YER057c/UK114 family)